MSNVKHQLGLLCSLSIFSILGALLRILLGQLFGQACHSGRSGWAPCVTDPGSTSAGGALFVDLPANMLGCFIMGILVKADGHLGMPVDMPVACLKRTSPLQKWTITHLGVRTGFCGSLTTFASWNTQMVVMIVGREGVAQGTKWVSASVGYLIGLGLAQVSFAAGRDLAIAVHRHQNPDLAREADQLMERRGVGSWIHRDLPDFERRYLGGIVLDGTDLLMDSVVKRIEKGDSSPAIDKDLVLKTLENGNEDIAHLKAWKDSTDGHRNGHIIGGQWASELQEIERAIFKEGTHPRQELVDLARDAGWDIDALTTWRETSRNKNSSESIDGSQHWHLLLIAIAFVLAVGLLLWGALKSRDDIYRSASLSALLAPLGTTARYYLSKLNGKVGNPNWEWLPIGTLIANLIASVISSVMAGFSVQGQGEAAELWINAIKSGFAGCLSTVSTFAAETAGLMRALPRHAWGYYYAFGSLLSACVLGVCSYVWAVV